MSLLKKIKNRTKRRECRNRTKVRRIGLLPRLSVFKSSKHIHAQIIDDSTHTTLASYSSLLLRDASGDKKAIARLVGVELARSAKEKGVESAVFDRGRFLYHGRIQEFAEGVRQGGLKI